MTKEEIVYKIEQIAHNGAFDGINADYVEREAEKLADKIVNEFTIPVVVQQSEQLFCGVEGGFCPYEEGNKKCRAEHKCINQVAK